MSIEDNILNTTSTENTRDAVNELLHSLAAARKFQHDKLGFGTERVTVYFEDVEGTWLEEWDDRLGQGRI